MDIAQFLEQVNALKEYHFSTIIVGITLFWVLCFVVLKISIRSKAAATAPSIVPSQGQAPSTTVTKLYVYPIKSCRAQEANEWKMNEFGLQFDRQWIVIDKKNGKFVTQRQIPKMVFIQPTVDANTGSLKIQFLEPETCKRDVKYPIVTITKEEYIHLQSEQMKQQDHLITAEIWSQQKLPSISMNNLHQIDDLLSQFLGKPVQLCMFPMLQYLQTKPQFAIREPSSKFTDPFYEKELVDKTKANVAYADGFPFLLIHEQSIQDLQNKLPSSQKLEVLRFRPNIVVNTENTSCAWSEDLWKTIVINQHLHFYNVKPCTRCTMPTVNLYTGKKEEQVGNMLQQQRMGKEPFDAPIVGINLIHQVEECNGQTIRVGDSVEVTSHYEKLPFERKKMDV